MSHTRSFRRPLSLSALIFLIAGSSPSAAPTGLEATRSDTLALVVLETTMGNIVIELFPDRAPKSVENFVIYVGSGFYDGLIFHRVLRDVLIQSGRVTEELEVQHHILPLLANEANNGLRNRRGTVAMARLADPHTAAAEFFINVSDNRDFDFRSKSREGWGYTVFGEVIRGMDVVDDIARLATRRQGEFRDLPREPVVITIAYQTDQLPAK